jgi:nucleotide-binding universal stress UspA family protein
MATFPTPELSTLLLASDGSEDARLARRAVADLAAASGATVHVVGAWDLAVGSCAPGVVVSEDAVLQVQEGMRTVVEEERRALLEAGVRRVVAHVEYGLPSNVILRVAREVGADLTVLGSRGRGAVARMVMGSVSETVVTAGAGPVLVVRGGDDAWPPQRLVAGCDGSRESMAAARLAATIARHAGAPLTVLDVVPAGPEGDITPRHPTFGDLLEGRRFRIERYTRRLRTPGGPPVLASVTSGDPATALIGAAGDGPASLVAVGRRGIGPLRHALIGSVSARVLHRAPGAVLVAPWSPRQGR